MDKFKFGLNSNQLKIIAAVTMTADHIGYMLLPGIRWLRIIGRLAFPIFAFCIFQGARYTHNKPKYLGGLLGLGLLCVLGYYIYCRELYTNALITFSLSVCILYGLDFFKACLGGKDIIKLLLSFAALTAALFAAYFVCEYFEADYGFPGVMLAVLAELSTLLNIKGKKENDRRFALIGFFAGLVWLSWDMGGIQKWCLLSLPLLLLYDGTRGKLKMKYFFYWFYPAHLILIGAAGMLL